MKCPKCRKTMRCLDTRWKDSEQVKTRRWRCECGVRGMTTERWIDAPAVPTPAKPKKITVNQAADRLMKAWHGGRVPKKEKDVVVKHTPTKSMFTDMDEGNPDEDFSDLGIDIPRGGDW
jgi:transcriptional regulator NrdR family protein